MSMEAGVEKMKMATIGQAYELPYRQAATEKLRRETELLGAEDQWQISEPDEFGRIFRTNLVTGRKEQVSGPTPTPPQTQEEKERLKRIATDIARGMYFENPNLPQDHPERIAWVNKGDTPPPGYTKPIVSREVQVSDLPAKRFDLAKDKAVRDSAVRIRMNLKNPAVMGEIEFINKNSESTSGFIWMEAAKTFWPDKKETVEVKLPKDRDGKQLTMADIRRIAELNNVAIEEVLRQIYDSQQE